MLIRSLTTLETDDEEAVTSREEVKIKIKEVVVVVMADQTSPATSAHKCNEREA